MAGVLKGERSIRSATDRMCPTFLTTIGRRIPATLRATRNARKLSQMCDKKGSESPGIRDGLPRRKSRKSLGALAVARLCTRLAVRRPSIG
jgi:hypothetical protein